MTWSGYRDQWLMEALANYSAMMLLETKDPAGFRKLLQKYRDNLLVKSKNGAALMDAGPVTLGMRLSSSTFPNAYYAISYGRGTWMFHMLRMMMRDAEPTSQRGKNAADPFLRALHTLRTDYEGRSVSTAQVLSVFEAQLPKPLWYEGQRSLAWFYESWLNGTAVPHFELRDVKFSVRGTTTLVTGTVVQDDAPESLVTPVPLYAVVSENRCFCSESSPKDMRPRSGSPRPGARERSWLIPNRPCSLDPTSLRGRNLIINCLSPILQSIPEKIPSAAHNGLTSERFFLLR